MEQGTVSSNKTDLKHATLTLLGYGDDDIKRCYHELKKISTDPEQITTNMLAQQAAILNAIFLSFCTLASPKNKTPPQAQERYMRLALKAQSQCRTTLESLEGIRNPKQMMQQNNATYQQVNT